MKKPQKKSYWSPSVTVDVIIFTVVDKRLKVLVVKRPKAPFKDSSALPGGFIHKGETALKTAARVLKEKAGVTNVYIEQLYTFDEPKRDPRGQVMSVAYFALVPFDKFRIVEGPTTEQPRLIDADLSARLAFDHSIMLAYAQKRLADKIQYSNIVYSLLPDYFTLSELQKTYEIILGQTLDKRNFIKRFMALDMIQITDQKLKGGRRRPAALYRFIGSKAKMLDRPFLNN